MATNWFLKTPADVFRELQTDEHGLRAEEAARRLQTYGPNVLPEQHFEGFALIFLRQFQSPLIYILFGASGIVFFMGETVDAVIILAVLFFNAAVGALQEGRAQNTLRALRQFAQTAATVVRDEKELIIPDTEAVPGDIMVLQEGEKVPADARVALSRNLKVDESALTGESVPVRKTEDALTRTDVPVAEQKNMVFKGTHVVAGSGRAVVVATGLNTVIGAIAQEVASLDTEIPLKANIRHLSQLVIGAVALMSAVLFAFGAFAGRPLAQMFATVVSLSVSVIPEGLPIVVTLVLATGVWRMSKRNALVKKLQAVEALGQARVIAVDKTGTITKNEMVIRKVYAGGRVFDITGDGYEPKGEAQVAGDVVDAANHPELLLAGKLSVFCANARVMFSEEEKRWRGGRGPPAAPPGGGGGKQRGEKKPVGRAAPPPGAGNGSCAGWP